MRYSRKYWALTERVTDELSTDYFEERVRTRTYKNKNKSRPKEFVSDQKNRLLFPSMTFKVTGYFEIKMYKFQQKLVKLQKSFFLIFMVISCKM